MVEELRTSLLVEEGVRERWTLEGFGGGRMEQGEVLDRFNLEEDDTDLGGRFPFSALSLSPCVRLTSLQLFSSVLYDLQRTVLIDRSSMLESREDTGPCFPPCTESER